MTFKSYYLLNEWRKDEKRKVTYYELMLGFDHKLSESYTIQFC